MVMDCRGSFPGGEVGRPPDDLRAGKVGGALLWIMASKTDDAVGTRIYFTIALARMELANGLYTLGLHQDGKLPVRKRTS